MRNEGYGVVQSGTAQLYWGVFWTIGVVWKWDYCLLRTLAHVGQV